MYLIICLTTRNLEEVVFWRFIPVAAQSKEWACGRTLAGIAGSNPTGGMDACPFWVFCVVRYSHLCRADHLSRGVLLRVLCLNEYDRETLGWKREWINDCKKTITRNCTQYCLAWVFSPFVHVVKFQYVSCVLLLVLSCFLHNCCWLTVCIVVVVLCVLLSYMYVLYCLGIAFF